MRFAIIANSAGKSSPNTSNILLSPPENVDTPRRTAFLNWCSRPSNFAIVHNKTASGSSGKDQDGVESGIRWKSRISSPALFCATRFSSAADQLEIALEGTRKRPHFFRIVGACVPG